MLKTGLIISAAWRQLSLVALFLASQASADFVFDPAVPTLQPETMQLLDIASAGNRVVAVGERGLVIYSDDQGNSWQQATVPVSATLTAIAFVGADKAWAVGHAGTILHSSDAGASWQLQFDGNQANTRYLEYTRQREIQLRQALAELESSGAGDTDSQELEYALEDAEYAIEDAEAAIGKGPADPFLDVLFLDADKGFAVGAYGMLYRTLDGGRNWVFAGTNIDNPDRFHYYSMARDDTGYLYLSGEAGLLFRSSDGGTSWQRIEDIYDGSLFGVVTTSGQVVAFGLRGNIFRSVDQGENWTPVNTANTFSLYGGGLLANGAIALVGAGGTVLLSQDGGTNFTLTTQPSRSTLSSIGQTGDQVLVVGMSGVEKVKQSEVAQ